MRGQLVRNNQSLQYLSKWHCLNRKGWHAPTEITRMQEKNQGSQKDKPVVLKSIFDVHVDSVQFSEELRNSLFPCKALFFKPEVSCRMGDCFLCDLSLVGLVSAKRYMRRLSYYILQNK